MPITRSQSKLIQAPSRAPVQAPARAPYITRSKVGIITEYDTGLDKLNKRAKRVPELIVPDDTPRMPNESLVDYVFRRGKYPPNWRCYVSHLPFTNEFIEKLWEKYDRQKDCSWISNFPHYGYRQDEEIYETLRKLADKNDKEEIRRLMKLPGIGWPVFSYLSAYALPS